MRLKLLKSTARSRPGHVLRLDLLDQLRADPQARFGAGAGAGRDVDAGAEFADQRTAAVGRGIASENVLASFVPGIHAAKKWCCSIAIQPPVTCLSSVRVLDEVVELALLVLVLALYHAAPWKLYDSGAHRPLLHHARGTRSSCR